MGVGDIKTASGSHFYIGPPADTTIDTLLEFQSITAWTEISLIENLGELGDQSNIVTGSAIGDGRVRKVKGARDAGDMAVVVFHDPTDAGQLAVETAEQVVGTVNYAFRLIVNDAPVGYNNTTKYFRGFVVGQRQNIGTNENIIRKNYTIAVNSAIVVDIASVM